MCASCFEINCQLLVGNVQYKHVVSRSCHEPYVLLTDVNIMYSAMTYHGRHEFPQPAFLTPTCPGMRFLHFCCILQYFLQSNMHVAHMWQMTEFQQHEQYWITKSAVILRCFRNQQRAAAGRHSVILDRCRQHSAHWLRPQTASAVLLAGTVRTSPTVSKYLCNGTVAST